MKMRSTSRSTKELFKSIPSNVDLNCISCLVTTNGGVFMNDFFYKFHSNIALVSCVFATPQTFFIQMKSIDHIKVAIFSCSWRLNSVILSFMKRLRCSAFAPSLITLSNTNQHNHEC